MARTPLMKGLRRLASEHAEGSAFGVEPSQVLQRRAAAAAWDRRTVLRSLGAATGAAVLGKSRPAQATSAKPRIAIVGAGIAGLAAALQLQDSGLASTIYESGDRVCGRMHSDTTDSANGQKSEWCGEFIDSGHATKLRVALTAELRASIAAFSRQGSISVSGSRGIFLSAKKLSFRAVSSRLRISAPWELFFSALAIVSLDTLANRAR